MSAKCFSRFGFRAALFLLAGSLAWQLPTHAQPTLLSSVPANGATGVSTSTTVKFTFSEAMNTSQTAASFADSGGGFYPTIPAWSAGNTVLTCTPFTPFGVNTNITWTVFGFSAGGLPLGGTGIANGSFFTGTGGGGGGGSGTNAITSFILGKVHYYHQTSTSLPTLDTNVPYYFSATTTLSSNRTATNIQLTLPTTGVSNLVQSVIAHEQYSLFGFNTNLTAFETTFPSGNYTFNVKAVASNQTVTVNFPSSLVQPGAPHVANYTAAQSVNPTLPFALTWDAFPGGTAADAIYVDIGGVFSSTNFGAPGALTGTATSLTIPAGTLQAGTNYSSSIDFYRFVSTTNGSSYVTTVYRATVTDFTLVTSGTASGSLVLTNAVKVPTNFSFDVLCSTGQTVTVEYRTNLAAGAWQTLFTTNSPGSRFHAVAPQAATNRTLFFRAKNGP